MTDHDTHSGSEASGRRRREIGTPLDTQRHLLHTRDADEHTRPAAEQPEPRSTDVDPKAAKRAERVVASLFLLGGAAGIAFMVAFVLTDIGGVVDTKWHNRWLGLSMTVTFLAFGAGLVHWVRRVMSQEEVVQERDPLPSSMEEKKEFVDYFLTGTEATGITKRPLLRRSLLAALVPLGVAPLFLLVPLGGDLPFRKLYHTVWRRGTRLVVYGTGEPIKPPDLAKPGSLLSVIPEGYEHDLDVLADAAVQVIKMRPGELEKPTRLDWTVDDIVAYSKICTHLGCATGLYEDTTHYILCPCHQSTFDASRGCEVVFGPAGHPLPQLPLGVDAQGYLIAMGDFEAPPGPSFWGRGSAPQGPPNGQDRG